MSGRGPGQTAVGDPAWAGRWTRGPPEVPSPSTILCFCETLVKTVRLQHYYFDLSSVSGHYYWVKEECAPEVMLLYFAY